MFRLFKRYFGDTRAWSYLSFFVIGLAGLVFYIPRIIRLGSRPANPIDGVAINVATSLFLLGLVELCAKFLEIAKEGPDRRSFQRFFGTGALDDEGYPTVFIQAELPDFPPGMATGQGNNIKLTAPPATAGSTHPKGIGHIIVYEDLEAVLEIDRLFRLYNARLKMCLDTYKTQSLPPRGCLSIGLGYNNVTVRIAADLCPELYEVTYDHSQGNNTDDFVLGTAAGIHEKGNAEKCDDYALIARVLDSKSRIPTPYIVCAGHTAQATVVACRFLAGHWKELVALYRKNQTVPKHLDVFNMAVILRFDQNDKDKPRVGKPRFIAI